jgi:hypothetical protein
MPSQRDDLDTVHVTGGEASEQVVCRGRYDDTKTGRYAFAVATVGLNEAQHRRRVAMRWCDQPDRKLGFPQSSARAAWFEVPPWMEAAILKAAAEQSAKEIREEG